MKLATSAGLILLTSVTLSWMAYHSLDMEQIEPSSPISVQKENRSRSSEYSLTFNGQPSSTYLSTLPSHEQDYFLPLFPILKAMGVDYQWNQSNDTVSIQDGENTVKLQLGEDFQTRNGYQIPISVSKDLNGEIWIRATSRNLPLLLGIDHISFNEQEQEWQLYRFQKQTDRQTSLEKASADLIKHYVTIFDSQPPMHSLNRISIESARQLTPADNLNQGVVKLVVRYSTYYNPSSFVGADLGYPVPGITRHEKIFLVRADQGKILIDDVIAHRINRTSTGSPIPLLEEEDYIEIGRKWQRKSPNANYYDLYLICRDFASSILNRIDTDGNFRLRELDDEEMLFRVSEEVRQSQGWKDFISLEGAKDPYYNILDATYDGQSLSATLIGNWSINGVSVTPILMEVELVKDENNSWKFTRLANVRLYQNARELELSEPETYSKIARLVSYHRDFNMYFGLGI